MSKGNRVKWGTGGRYDFGESGYMDNLRRQAEKPPQLIHMARQGTRICQRCKVYRPIKGGSLTNSSRNFVCVTCKAP